MINLIITCMSNPRIHSPVSYGHYVLFIIVTNHMCFTGLGDGTHLSMCPPLDVDEEIDVVTVESADQLVARRASHRHITSQNLFGDFEQAAENAVACQFLTKPESGHLRFDAAAAKEPGSDAEPSLPMPSGMCRTQASHFTVATEAIACPF